MLTRFGGGGRSEHRDHQQDEEEQVEDPHDCARNLVKQVGLGLFFLLLPKLDAFALRFRTSLGNPGYRTQRGRSFVRIIRLSLRNARVQREWDRLCVWEQSDKGAFPPFPFIQKEAGGVRWGVSRNSSPHLYK